MYLFKRPCSIALNPEPNILSPPLPSHCSPTQTRKMTADGLEANLAVNYLGNFLLTTQLLAILNKSPDARVLCVNSSLHRIVSFSVCDRGALACRS